MNKDIVNLNLQQHRPKHPHLHADQILFEVIAGLLGAFIFYAIYFPYYTYGTPGVSFEHYSFVLIISTFVNIIVPLFAVIIIYCWFSNKPLGGLFRYYGITDFVKLVSMLFVELVNAAIFALGLMFIIREKIFTSIDVNNMQLVFQWFFTWVVVKIGIRVAGIFVAQYMQSRVVLFGFFLIAFVLIFLGAWQTLSSVVVT